jgi:hypothetical protein
MQSYRDLQKGHCIISMIINLILEHTVHTLIFLIPTYNKELLGTITIFRFINLICRQQNPPAKNSICRNPSKNSEF